MKPLRYLVRWPLRYFLPVALLCIALGVSVIQYEVELRMRQAAVQQQMQETLQHDLYRLKSSLEYLLLRGDLDRARYEVAELGALPGIIEAWLIDRNDRIIAASRIARIGQHQPRPAIPTPRSGLPWVVAENGRLQGYQLLTIQRDPTSLRPDRDGLLYISLDLTPVFAEAKAQVRREALQFGGFALVLALLLGWYFTFAVSRRLQRMEQAAQQIAQGDFHLRLGLEGDDELAHLGQSFDHMTERLQMIWEEHGRQQQALAEANAELRG
ncbi:MAG: HAMP domain-containing protein, partial [Methylophilaceae bacterium]|nr:HAMP domain-containing protein [Methylophilaceae bacterium]